MERTDEIRCAQSGMAIDPWREQNKKAKSGLPSMCEVLDLTASVAERQTDRQSSRETKQSMIYRVMSDQRRCCFCTQ
jgi:hypothetical protein